MGKSETTKNNAACAEAGCCGGLNCGSNGMMYCAIIFLFGLIIGGLGGYWYLVGQQPPTDVGICTTDLAGTSSAVVEKAISFINNELVSEGIVIKAEGAANESMSARAVRIGVYAGSEKLQANTIYVINNTIVVIPGGYYDISDYVAPNKSSKPPVTSTMPKSDTPEVKFFVMSFCPYGQQAEAGLKPVAELLGDSANLEPHFVIYDNYCGWGVKCKATEEDKNAGYKEDATARAKYCLDATNEVPQYCSMHGIDELMEGVRQLCVWKYEKAKFWPYVAEINAKCSSKDVATCWKDAAKTAGIDTVKIEDCEKNEATVLLAEEAKLNAQYGVQGSPSVFVNNATYTGARTAEGYKAAVCSAFNTAPGACNTTLDSDAATADGGCGG